MPGTYSAAQSSAPCQSSDSQLTRRLVYRSRYARSFSVHGAGEVSVNGLYLRTNQTMDGFPVFQLDATHQLCPLY